MYFNQLFWFYPWDQLSEHDMLSPNLKRIGSWIQFEKIDGDGPDEGWLKYYGQGKRLAKRTAANDIAIMQSNFGIVPNEALGLGFMYGSCPMAGMAAPTDGSWFHDLPNGHGFCPSNGQKTNSTPWASTVLLRKAFVSRIGDCSISWNVRFGIFLVAASSILLSKEV